MQILLCNQSDLQFSGASNLVGWLMNSEILMSMNWRAMRSDDINAKLLMGSSRDIIVFLLKDDKCMSRSLKGWDQSHLSTCTFARLINKAVSGRGWAGCRGYSSALYVD